MSENRQFPKIMLCDEMKLYENYDTNSLNKNERFYLDLFLLSFYTGGISLKDFASLKWDDIKGDELNTKGFKYPLLTSMTLCKEAIEIINKYKKQSYRNYVLPIFSYKHLTLTQKEGRISRLASKVNLTLHKISETLQLEGDSPTWKTAKYSFIAKLYECKMPIKDIYTFSGPTALVVEEYLYEQEDPVERDRKLREIMDRL